MQPALDPEIDSLFKKMLSKKPQTVTLASALQQEQAPRCPKCHDREFIITDNGAIPCSCRKQKIIERNIKSSMVDENFKNAIFANFRILPHVREMYRTALDYAKNFEVIRIERANGLAFTAKVGESRIKEYGRRAAMKEQHNSYGLGKTHLLSSIANNLLTRGIQVIMVCDTDIVAELRQGQIAETPEEFEKLIFKLETAELLIWDDLGKAKTTDWVLNQYYRIFNYRYRNGLPICISTNEDMDTLAERIGDATASRLYAICKPRLVACEGPDYRLI